jgi:hypothetical protein
MRPLTKSELKGIRTIPDGDPVRFMFEGQSVDIVTGELTPKNVNVIFQKVYWNVDRPTAKRIAKLTGTKATW